MKEYIKIQTLFKRDLSNKGRIIETEWSLPEFEYLKNNKWTFTEKVDGTNIRLKWEHGELSIRCKTDNAQIHAGLIDAISAMGLTDKLSTIWPNTDACLYGEGYGPGIQKGGGNYRQDKGFVLFDVLCGDFWLQHNDVHDIAVNLGIDVVPIMGTDTLGVAIELTRAGFNSMWGSFPAEGLVMRPLTELRTRWGDRLIAKIKHIDFTGWKF